MRERPILFSAPMVRALFDGTKTQTRHVVKPQPRTETEPVRPEPREGARWVFMADADRSTRFAFGDVKCPFGEPGDRLWVRETWKVSSESNHYPTDEKHLYVEFRAGAVAGTGQQRSKFSVERDAELARAAWGNGKSHAWRPSIHMPRWASRITLEVTGVRVERLQSISEEDARAEGVERSNVVINGHNEGVRFRDYDVNERDHAEWFNSARDSFASLWESINGAGVWARNPWVWVVSFRRVTP